MGITDDVMFHSLPYTNDLSVLPETTTECLFWGMGSDGTVGANKEAVKIIASRDNMNAQVRPNFVVFAGLFWFAGRMGMVANRDNLNAQVRGRCDFGVQLSKFSK